MVARLPIPVVLFADRDLSWSRSVRGELRRRGANVLMASNVDEAFHQAALSSPDLIVLDEHLEGRGDRNLAEVFLKALPRTRIILLQVQGSDWRPGTLPGLFASGPRPSSPDALMGLAQGALGKRLHDAPKSRRGTVLCVDDDSNFLRSVARLLSRRGYQVSAF